MALLPRRVVALPLVAAALLPLLTAAPAAAATPAVVPAAVPAATAGVRTAEQLVQELSARVDAVAAQLSEGAARYEQDEALLGAGLAEQVAAERAAEASARRGASADEAVRRLVLARYSDPRPDGLLRLLGASPVDVGDALATQAVLARVQGAYDGVLRAASADRARADADAAALAARRAGTSAAARQHERDLADLRTLADATAVELEAAALRLRLAQQAERREREEQQRREREEQQRREQRAPRAGAPRAAGPPDRCTRAAVDHSPGRAGGRLVHRDVAGDVRQRLRRRRRPVPAADRTPAPAAGGRRPRVRRDEPGARAADRGGAVPHRLLPQLRCAGPAVPQKPRLAAVPGTSNHGRGLAVDLCGGAERFDGAAHRWLQANAGRFGWVHPAWARQGGRREEPWHWEYGAL